MSGPLEASDIPEVVPQPQPEPEPEQPTESIKRQGSLMPEGNEQPGVPPSKFKGMVKMQMAKAKLVRNMLKGHL